MSDRLTVTPRKKDRFFGPPLPKSAPSRSVLDSKMINPFLKAFYLTVKRYKYIQARISRLLFSCGPAAISRLVIAVVVDSVNRMLLAWWRAHVSKKVLKCVPAFAHRNPTSCPAFILIVSCCLTPFTHCSPSSPRFCVRATMGFVGFDFLLQPNASATTDFTRSQSRSFCPSFIPAITFASVGAIPSNHHMIARQHGQSAKSHSNGNRVFQLQHGITFAKQNGFSKSQNSLHI